MIQVLSPIFVLGVLIVVHELGHFLVAKWCGVGVLKFAIGFGPAIIRFRYGETTYQVGLIPLGGFVRMVGDMPDSFTGPQPTDAHVRSGESKTEVEEEFTEAEARIIADKNRWFIHKSLWQRSAIVFAGPLFNFLLAIAVLAFAVFVYGKRVPGNEPIIGIVSPNFPADSAGIQTGDKIVSVNETAVNSWNGLRDLIHFSDGSEVRLVVDRDGEQFAVNVQPKRQDLGVGDRKEVFIIGIGPEAEIVPAGLFESVELGLSRTLEWTGMTYYGLWGMISGEVSPKDLAGPIFIVKQAGTEAKRGFENLLFFMALLSVSLAVLNLLPIPVLDGGHLLFFLIEAIVGPISIKKKEIAQQVGVVALLLLMAFAVKNDLTRGSLDSDSGSETGTSSPTKSDRSSEAAKDAAANPN